MEISALSRYLFAPDLAALPQRECHELKVADCAREFTTLHFYGYDLVVILHFLLVHIFPVMFLSFNSYLRELWRFIFSFVPISWQLYTVPC